MDITLYNGHFYSLLFNLVDWSII